MAEGEEEVHYASGVFKAGNNPPPAAKRAEETVYVEVKVQNETKNEAKRGEETVYDEVKVQNETKNEDSAGHRRFQHLACCLGILCVILLGGIIGVCVYVTKLSLENANMKRDNKNLTDQLGNLKKDYTVSKSNVKNLSAEVKKLKSINADCKHKDKTNCQACQDGWLLTEPSCYAYNDAPPSRWNTWEEAREDCKGKNSDLVVANDLEEKNDIIDTHSPGSSGTNGFWIGLKVEDGKWKWVDGIDSFFNADRCEISVVSKINWVSVSCGDHKQWICQKKALSLSVCTGLSIKEGY
ncbi:killer cell lectin-like receptor subfamily B member 1B allele B isoform X7 [Trematomus bernacchii]|uniref:killer cell lectin-like receptor subfamily B member 1B allele B isoform X7 n=1 Tax=Trematomus bernacchii TaxID=40690 RepID=UPI00146E2127|nr:killer cell lectin-like receptor subfamily B member 1B allele B isoform X7 [Trematomus bernacchii]